MTNNEISQESPLAFDCLGQRPRLVEEIVGVMITVVLLRPLGVMLIISSIQCVCAEGSVTRVSRHVTSVTLYILAPI